MKHLAKHKKEFVATTVAAIMAVITILKGFGVDINIGTEEVTAIITAVTMYVVWYFNMPTSEENCEATGEMRNRKAAKKEGYNGETYEEVDEPEEVEANE